MDPSLREQCILEDEPNLSFPALAFPIHVADIRFRCIIADGYSPQWPSVLQLLKWITLNPGCWDICTTCSGYTTLTDTQPDGKPIVQVLRSCCLGHLYTFDNHRVSPVQLCVMHRDGLCRLDHTSPQIYSAHLLGYPGLLPCYHKDLECSSWLVTLGPAWSVLVLYQGHPWWAIMTSYPRHYRIIWD